MADERPKQAAGQSGGRSSGRAADAHAHRRAAKRRTSARNGFGFTAGWTVLGTLIPGLGLIKAGRRALGGLLLCLFLSIPVVFGLWALIDRSSLMGLAVSTSFLSKLPYAIAALAVVWVVLIVATHIALRPRLMTRTQRGLGALLVGALAFGVTAPMAVAARYSSVQADLVGTVFQSEGNSKSATRPTPGSKDDPWKDKPRLNVLLLGGDGGKGREGVRTDTVIVASIDTTTGNTTMFSLPRNTARMPFPKDSKLHEVYPDGFFDGYNGDDPEFMLNAMYGNVPAAHPDILGETDNLGADAMKLSVGEALGLNIDYYALVNLQGFTKLINALGGITVNINAYIPIGGATDTGVLPTEFLAPGADQKLAGREALWYARGRFGGDDFERMDRQRCVINAVIRQANPQTVLTRYEAIANASKSIVYTDIPQENLSSLLDLALRVRDAKTRSVVFKSGKKGFVSGNPDFDVMRKRVGDALDETKKAPAQPEAPAAPKTPKTSSSSSATSSPSAEPTGASENTDETCAYDPAAAKEAEADPPYWVKRLQ